MESIAEDADESDRRIRTKHKNNGNFILRCRRNGYLVSSLILALLSGFTYSFNVIENETKTLFEVSDIFMSILYPFGILSLVLASLFVDKIRRQMGLRGSILIGAILSLIGLLLMGIFAHLASSSPEHNTKFVCFYVIAYLSTNMGLGFGYYMGFKVLIDYTPIRSTTISMSIFSVLFLSGNIFFLGIKELFHCTTLHSFLYTTFGVLFVLFAISILLLRKPETIGRRRSVSDSNTTLPDKKKRPKPNLKDLNTYPIILCFLLSFFIIGWVQFSYNFNSELIRYYSGDDFEQESIKHNFISFLFSTLSLLLTGTALDILETKNIKNKSILFILIITTVLFISSFVSIFVPAFMVTRYLSSIIIGVSGCIFILLPKCFTEYTDNKSITVAMGIGDFLGFIGTLIFSIMPPLMYRTNKPNKQYIINCTLFITITTICYILILIMIIVLFSKEKKCRSP